MNTLTLQDIEMILDSLKYTYSKFENYQGYPSPEFKQQRLESVRDVISKVNKLKGELSKK